jgi:hypothetical protein
VCWKSFFEDHFCALDATNPVYFILALSLKQRRFAEKESPKYGRPNTSL